MRVNGAMTTRWERESPPMVIGVKSVFSVMGG
jgi:hypothetical protein